MHPLLAAALQRASQTGQAVPVTIGSITMTAYPNGQVGGPPGSTTARWTPQQTPQIPQQPVQPSNPFNAAGVQGPAGSPSGPTPTSTYVDPNTFLPYTANRVPTTAYYTPGTTLPGPAVPSQEEQSAGTGLPLTGTPVSTTPSVPGSSGPVDRHDPVAAQARIYRINHGISTPDDSAATDALNAESLAAARAGRTSFNPQLAAQYGQTPAAGTYGPRTDVVNALSMPTTQGQAIMLAPTTTTQQQPAVLATTGNNLLAQGIY